MRRRAREAALRTLYRCEYQPAPTAELLTDEEDMSPAEARLAADLLTGVLDRREELDKVIDCRAVGWGVDRLSLIDLNLLRLALYELLHTDTPAEVVMDEAVELAKSYGTEKAPAFINGILDRVRREASGDPTH
ncbi:MAG: transcription antitermination factor NusB [Candidatus Bipolaricaulota bacterium]